MLVSPVGHDSQCRGLLFPQEPLFLATMAMNTFVESWHAVLVYSKWGVRFSISGEMQEQSAPQHVPYVGRPLIKLLPIHGRLSMLPQTFPHLTDTSHGACGDLSSASADLQCCAGHPDHSVPGVCLPTVCNLASEARVRLKARGEAYCWSPFPRLPAFLTVSTQRRRAVPRQDFASHVELRACTNSHCESRAPIQKHRSFERVADFARHRQWTLVCQAVTYQIKGFGKIFGDVLKKKTPYLTVIAPVTDRTLELTSRPDGG